MFHDFAPQHIYEYAFVEKSLQLLVSLRFSAPRHDVYCKIWVKPGRSNFETKYPTKEDQFETNSNFAHHNPNSCATVSSILSIQGSKFKWNLPAVPRYPRLACQV
ncbi:MAG: hypothetical protein V3V90_09070, partial [Thermodesulfobacteriota bacterium]